MSKRPVISLYCTCGFAVQLTFCVGASRTTQQRAASRVFAGHGTGAGHALCDRRTAERARRREEETQEGAES